MAAIALVATVAMRMGLATARAMMRGPGMLDTPARDCLRAAEDLRRAGFPVHADVVAGLPAKARDALAAPGDTIEGTAVDIEAVIREIEGGAQERER